MQPIRSILEIRYRVPAARYNIVSGIIQALGGTLSEKATLPAQNLRLAMKERKIGIYVEAKRFALNIEEEIDEAETYKLILDLTKRLDDYLHWGAMERVGFRTIWIKKVDSFEQLVKQSKEKLFKNNSLLAESVDVAMPLTLLHGKNRINYNYGPMTRGELAQRGFEFSIEQDRVPEAFAYIDVDYYLTTEQHFSLSFLKSFLTDGYEVASKKTSETLSILGI